MFCSYQNSFYSSPVTILYTKANNDIYQPFPKPKT